ncbi:hypothetical protein [Chroococcidiopsis sp. CCMEE 29]|jgi:hypothetical protein|uniref:DUF6887 family protein n=1 Tax=Chroococcidiopsis sp. CCMEE 29 TaxID=155894 RepID=UPI002022149A|nr:hypothetical protein [Chroococcidiopsis sp. CCMEE 29]
MKPNFHEMSYPELRKYIFANRQDSEAFGVYLDRLHADPNIKWIRGDTPEGLKLFEEKLKKGMPSQE